MTNPEKRKLIDRLRSIEERLLIIVNPMSKKGSELAGRLRSMLRREGMSPEETSTDLPDDAGQTVEFWSKRFGGSRVIMVFGGDGALNQVINNIMLSRASKNVVLVPIPAGTANDFCRALGLENAESALNALVEFNLRPVDLMKITLEGQKKGVRYSSNVFGIGLDGDLVRRSLKYKRFGVPGYWYASLKRAAVVIFRGLETYRVKLEAGDYKYDGPVIGVMFAKISTYGKSFMIAPGARPDDGRIYMTVVKPMSGLKAFIATLLLLRGLHTKVSGVDFVVCENVSVELLENAFAQEDGELLFYPGGTKFQISIDRGAINVLSPIECSASKS